MKINFSKFLTAFGIFAGLNLLTMPLSPYASGGGLMTKDEYAPIMTAKLVIMGMFAIVGLSIVNSSKKNSKE